MNTCVAHCCDSSCSIDDHLWPENVSVFFFYDNDGNLLNHDGSAINIF